MTGHISNSMVIVHQKMEFKTPIEAIKAGVNIIYQERQLVGELTVAENIFMEDMYHSLVVDVVQDDNKVTGVVVENTNGTMIINGKVIVDCTGEGDIASRAGAPWEYVDRKTVQPHTISFTMDGVDWERVLDYVHNNPDQLMWFEHVLPHWSDERKEEAHQKALEFYKTCDDPAMFGEMMGFFKFRDEALPKGDWHPYSGVGFFLTPREGGHIQAHMQHSFLMW